jgi:hypothetical protein
MWADGNSTSKPGHMHLLPLLPAHTRHRQHTATLTLGGGGGGGGASSITATPGRKGRSTVAGGSAAAVLSSACASRRVPLAAALVTTASERSPQTEEAQNAHTHTHTHTTGSRCRGSHEVLTQVACPLHGPVECAAQQAASCNSVGDHLSRSLYRLQAPSASQTLDRSIASAILLLRGPTASPNAAALSLVTPML